VCLLSGDRRLWLGRLAECVRDHEREDDPDDDRVGGGDRCGDSDRDDDRGGDREGDRGGDGRRRTAVWRTVLGLRFNPLALGLVPRLFVAIVEATVDFLVDRR